MKGLTAISCNANHPLKPPSLARMERGFDMTGDSPTNML